MGASMNQPMRIVVTGASGRMGRMLTAAVEARAAAEGDVKLVAALVREGHDWVGRDLGEATGGQPSGLVVSADPLEAFAAADAVLDFTAQAATVANAALAAQARMVHVIGTTGLSEDDLAAIAAAARHAVVIRADNTSLGVNLLAQFARQAAAALGPDWDIEVLEMHHRMKVDAPSGTALMLGQAAAEGRGVALEEKAVRSRDGHTGARKPGDIGFATLRGGDVAGEHDVIFAGAGERIVLRHVATDRGVFARGAVAAALWGRGRKPGQYSMADVLGMAA